MKLNDKIYNVLKWVVLIALPAISVFITTLQKAWGWDIPIEAITITINAVALLIGTLIGISTYSYNKTKEV